ncbi:MAG: hypothetical protein OK456_05970 [Thaumarchaeota archaeon]|nr:hypothetical protein [Nitrososphaerota archaeon]
MDSASRGRPVLVSQTGPVKIAENRRGVIQVIRKSMKKAGRTGDPEVDLVKQRKRGALCGTPEEVVAQINERKELGVQRFYLEVVDLETEDMADILTQTLKHM